MRLVFMGTPEIAVPSLERIARSNHTIRAVFTQPDRVSGRGRVLTPPPVKTWALEREIKVFQPDSLKPEGSETIFNEIDLDCIVAVAYGLILPRKILEIPPLGCVNLHFSLLPRYRGAAPVNWALVRGERATGVTTFLMNEKMDQGDILLQEEVSIQDCERADHLLKRLSDIGSHLLVETLDLLERGRLKTVPQDHSKATHAPIIKKEDGRLCWTRTASTLACMIRGFYPWPGAFSFLNGKSVKILEAHEHVQDIPQVLDNEPGTILSFDGDALNVLCGEKSVLSITVLQPEGRKEMTAREAVNGRHLKIGDRFAG